MVVLGIVLEANESHWVWLEDTLGNHVGSGDDINYEKKPVGSLLDNPLTKRQDADTVGSRCDPWIWEVSGEWVLM